MPLLFWRRTETLQDHDDPEEPDDDEYQDDQQSQELDASEPYSGEDGESVDSSDSAESEATEDVEEDNGEEGDEDEASPELPEDGPRRLETREVTGVGGLPKEPPFFATLGINEYGRSSMALRTFKAKAEDAAVKASRMGNAKTPQARTELAEAFAVATAYNIALQSATHDDFKRLLAPKVREIVRNANAGVSDIKDWVKELYIFGQANTAAYPIFEYA